MSKKDKPQAGQEGWQAPVAPPRFGFDEAPQAMRGMSLRGLPSAGADSPDRRFIELTALVRAYSAIDDDEARARVLALARSLAEGAQKP